MIENGESKMELFEGEGGEVVVDCVIRVLVGESEAEAEVDRKRAG